MSLFRRAMMAAATASGPPAFSYDDIPSQLLRINSLEGSLTGSGGVLTGVTDVSGAGETVTVTGSPVYTAADANLNGAPSFRPASGALVTTPNIVRSSVKFLAVAAYSDVTSLFYFWDQSDTAHGMRVYRLNGTIAGAFGSLAAAGEPVAGRKRLIANFDTTGRYLYLNGTNLGTPGALAPTGTNGIVWGSANDGTLAMTTAFVMACSAPPSAPLLASLEAKLLADFG